MTGDIQPSDPGPQALERIRERITETAPSLHTAGTLSGKALDALFRHASRRRIDYSAETGAGATTLLMSHLSKHHTVFALDGGTGSIRNVRRSELLREEAVAFVEGPTQQTLPAHEFDHNLQAVILDGPHAYPFPDLEYYFLYPHLDRGALLVVDDIHIRSIHNLFQFLRADAMFHLDEVVDFTAFFTRTAAPTFDPAGDQWWEQNYNRRLLFRYTWKGGLKRSLPFSVWRPIDALSRRGTRSQRSCRVEILNPQNEEQVTESGIVEGTAFLAADSHLWVLVHRKDWDGWWPQGGGAAAVDEGRWRIEASYGEPRDAGYEFEIAALAVGEGTHKLWTDWVLRAQSGTAAPVRLPSARFVFGEAYRTVRKAPRE